MTPGDVAAILWKHRDAARSGAWDAKVPTRYLDDVVQESLAAAWHLHLAGRLRTPPGEALVPTLRAFLRQTAFNIGRRMMKKLRREETRADLTEDMGEVDPHDMLDARDELRRMVRRARFRDDLPVSLEVFVFGANQTTRHWRLAVLRGRVVRGARPRKK